MSRLLILLLLALSSLSSGANLVRRITFDLADHNIHESLSRTPLPVKGNFMPENVNGVDGKALRFDGYSTYIEAYVPEVCENATYLAVFLRLAVETYPIIEIDTDTDYRMTIVDCLTDSTGFAFELGYDGRLSFTLMSRFGPVTVESSEPLPRGEWASVTAVADSRERLLRLYLNRQEVGTANISGLYTIPGGLWRIGRNSPEYNNSAGPFVLTSFNGMIDDLRIWDELLVPEAVALLGGEEEADFAVSPSRFTNDHWRPKFHGQPSANWTNEPHGLVKSGGKYHIFFQKNANGPYMARLHWGHISSPDLIHWSEEPIALAPDRDYDIKGCWSGCVFTDPDITGSLPAIIYPSISWDKASISMATTSDSTLRTWHKSIGNPIIPHVPSGMADDFRDPYFFSHNGEKYIIVGTSGPDSIGAATLHRYNPATRTWSDTGRLFFHGTSKDADGRFWEMPTINEIRPGKWLFTATPLDTSDGVKLLYWTGSFNPDGTFAPDAESSTPRPIEPGNIDGYGMLSPSVSHIDGRLLAVGIVPDKLPEHENHRIGWAHLYSLPREWSLDARNNLVQRPFSGLKAMRSDVKFERHDLITSDTLRVDPVKGKQVELFVEFPVTSNPLTVDFFKNASGHATLTLDPLKGELIVDATRLPRVKNDRHSYKGIYRYPLPEEIRIAPTATLDLFIDGSVVDIFVNDIFATSLRLFPADSDAEYIELITPPDLTRMLSTVQAWVLE